jgi:putative SOS response-associated peptidase YedK
VPADGFYEWKPHPKRRRPHHVRLGAGELFGLAGLFEAWESPEGEAIQSCTLLTTAANAVLHALHHRMPIIVDPQHYQRWLDPDLQDPDAVHTLTDTDISDRLRFHAVDFHVNSPRNDDPSCIEPIEPGELRLEEF